MKNAKKKQKWLFSLNSISPVKVSQKRVAPNVLGILQENIYESLIFYKSNNSVNWVLRNRKFPVQIAARKPGGERELQSNIIGRTLETSIYVRKVIFVFSSANVIISRIFKINFGFVTEHKLCSRESTWDAWQ